MLLNSQTVLSAGQTTCRGLTPAEYTFLTLGGKKETWNPPERVPGEKLKTAKLAALRFLSTGAWSDEQRYLPTLLASAHSINEDSKVVELAEEIFKRSAPGVPLDSDGVGESLVKALYQYFFFGEEEEGGVSRGIPPMRWTLRQRIVAILSKSKTAVSGDEFGRKVPLVLQITLGKSIADTVVDWADPGDRRKLKREAFLFVNWFSRMSDVIERYGPGIVENLRYFIAEENNRILEGGGSASILSGGFKGTEDLRALAFEAIGLICRRLFKTLVYEPELDVLRFMFSNLQAQGATATAAVRQSVEEALSSLLVGFSSAGIEYNEKVEDAMAEFFVEEVEAEVKESGYGHARKEGLTYVSARFANRGLSFSNVKARWICLLAIGASSGSAGGRNELVEEGHRGLDPYWYKMTNPRSQILSDEDKMEVDVKTDRYSLPDFVELIEYITSIHARLSNNIVGENMLHNIPSAIYANAVDYCRKILILQAISSSPQQLEEFTSDAQYFTTKLDNAFATDSAVRDKVAELVASYYHSGSQNHNAIEKFLTIAYDGMLLDVPNCAEAWVDLCELAPQEFIVNWARQADKVTPLLKMIVDEAFSTTGGGGNRDLEKRNLLVKALGSVITHPACNVSLQDAMGKFHKMSQDGGYKSYTAIISIGYILGRLALRNRLAESLDQETISKSVEVILKSILSPTLPDKLVIEAGLQALGDICVFGVLQKEHLKGMDDFLEKLKMLASKLNMEKAITGLGCFSLLYSNDIEEDQKVLSDIESSLYALHENKQLELSFAIGEALSIFAAGWGCKPLARRYLDIQGVSPPAQIVERRKDGKLLKKVLSKTLDDFAKSTKPSLRRGVCVWLLSLVEGCGELEEVNSRLKDAQTAFRGFLADREGEHGINATKLRSY